MVKIDMILKNVNNEVNNLVDLVMFIKMSKLDIPCIFSFSFHLYVHHNAEENLTVLSIHYNLIMFFKITKARVIYFWNNYELLNLNMF